MPLAFFADAKQRFNDIGTFSAHQSGNAEDFTFMQIE